MGREREMEIKIECKNIENKTKTESEKKMRPIAFMPFVRAIHCSIRIMMALIDLQKNTRTTSTLVKPAIK